MFSLIADGKHRPTSLGRDTWKKLFGDSASLEPYCNLEGFNARCSSPVSRIGIITNDNLDCIHCGANIAFGSNDYGCVNVGSPQADNGNELNSAMGYIMVYWEMTLAISTNAIKINMSICALNAAKNHLP